MFRCAFSVHGCAVETADSVNRFACDFFGIDVGMDVDDGHCRYLVFECVCAFARFDCNTVNVAWGSFWRLHLIIRTGWHRIWQRF